MNSSTRSQQQKVLKKQSPFLTISNHDHISQPLGEPVSAKHLANEFMGRRNVSPVGQRRVVLSGKTANGVVKTSVTPSFTHPKLSNQ